MLLDGSKAIGNMARDHILPEPVRQPGSLGQTSRVIRRITRDLLQPDVDGFVILGPIMIPDRVAE